MQKGGSKLDVGDRVRLELQGWTCSQFRDPTNLMRSGRISDLGPFVRSEFKAFGLSAKRTDFAKFISACIRGPKKISIRHGRKEDLYLHSRRASPIRLVSQNSEHQADGLIRWEVLFEQDHKNGG